MQRVDDGEHSNLGIPGHPRRRAVVLQIPSAAQVMTVPSQIRDPRSQLARDSTKKLASLISRSSRGLPAAVDSPQRFGAEHT